MNNFDQQKLFVSGLQNGCSEKVENVQRKCRKARLHHEHFLRNVTTFFRESYFTKQLWLLVMLLICLMNQIITVLIWLPKQKHSPKVALERSCSEKFHKFHWKKPFMKSFLRSVATCNFLRRPLSHMFSYDFCRVPQKTSEQHFLNKQLLKKKKTNQKSHRSHLINIGISRLFFIK